MMMLLRRVCVSHADVLCCTNNQRNVVHEGVEN